MSVSSLFCPWASSACNFFAPSFLCWTDPSFISKRISFRSLEDILFISAIMMSWFCSPLSLPLRGRNVVKGEGAAWGEELGVLVIASDWTAVNAKHLAVLGWLQVSCMSVTDVVGCSKGKDDSGILNGDSPSVMDPASLAVSWSCNKSRFQPKIRCRQV